LSTTTPAQDGEVRSPSYLFGQVDHCGTLPDAVDVLTGYPPAPSASFPLKSSTRLYPSATCVDEAEWAGCQITARSLANRQRSRAAVVIVVADIGVLDCLERCEDFIP